MAEAGKGEWRVNNEVFIRFYELLGYKIATLARQKIMTERQISPATAIDAILRAIEVQQSMPLMTCFFEENDTVGFREKVTELLGGGWQIVATIHKPYAFIFSEQIDDFEIQRGQILNHEHLGQLKFVVSDRTGEVLVFGRATIQTHAQT